MNVIRNVFHIPEYGTGEFNFKILDSMATALGYSRLWRKVPITLPLTPPQNSYRAPTAHVEWNWLKSIGLATTSNQKGNWITFSLTESGIEIVTNWLLTAPPDRKYCIENLNKQLERG